MPSALGLWPGPQEEPQHCKCNFQGTHLLFNFHRQRAIMNRVELGGWSGRALAVVLSVTLQPEGVWTTKGMPWCRAAAVVLSVTAQSGRVDHAGPGGHVMRVMLQPMTQAACCTCLSRSCRGGAAQSRAGVQKLQTQRQRTHAGTCLVATSACSARCLFAPDFLPTSRPSPSA